MSSPGQQHPRGRHLRLKQGARTSVKQHYRKQIEKAAAGVRPAGPGRAAAQRQRCGPGGGGRLTTRGIRQRAGCSPLAGQQHIGTTAANRTDVTEASSKHQQTPLGHCRERCTWKRSDVLRQRPFSSGPRDTSAAKRPHCHIPHARCPSHQHQLPEHRQRPPCSSLPEHQPRGIPGPFCRWPC